MISYLRTTTVRHFKDYSQRKRA
jgi:hypothetical protein